ncbi:MAG TPA: hypothetical protein VFP84_25740 [Kofleriaceae bacterium]|nr:hypothetical protein [Kofleriaceae bacterium]
MKPRAVGGAAVPAEVAAAVAGLGLLEDVIRHPALRLVDVIVQDEYTHDVVVAAGAGFVVFDTT